MANSRPRSVIRDALTMTEPVFVRRTPMSFNMRMVTGRAVTDTARETNRQRRPLEAERGAADDQAEGERDPDAHGREGHPAAHVGEHGLGRELHAHVEHEEHDAEVGQVGDELLRVHPVEPRHDRAEDERAQEYPAEKLAEYGRLVHPGHHLAEHPGYRDYEEDVYEDRQFHMPTASRICRADMYSL